MSLLQEITKSANLNPEQVSLLEKVEAGSPFMMRLLANNQLVLDDVINHADQALSLSDMQAFIDAQTINDEAGLKKALRQLRQRVMARIILRDLNGLADFHEVVQTISQFAEFAIQTAADYLNRWQATSYGEPVDEAGKPQELIVVGMGKLGGGELNVSSDVDLIFAYAQSGKTNGDNSISNQDYFVRLGKSLISALDEVTEDGFVFRVDMRLRPFGSEGVLVSSLDALEEYYQNNGREWERYAWIKGRAVTDGDTVSELLKPFVYRKYLDYGAFASMRVLKAQIQQEVNARSARSANGKDNIKLGRGGIREIEFIAQVFQLIRGGQDPSLRIRPTLQVLALLKDKHLLPAEDVDALTEAYVFLRNLEHRLMYVDDAQTQDLPSQAEAQSRIAMTMGFDDWDSFMTVLNQHRDIVQRLFDDAFSEVKGDDVEAEPSEQYMVAQSIWNHELDDEQSQSALHQLGYRKPDDTLNRIQHLRQSHRYKQMPDMSRRRCDQLLPMLIEESGQQANADIALMRTMDFVESVCRRANYLVLMVEYPQALKLVVAMCSASAWCAQYLTKHPIVLDELLDEDALYAAPDFNEMKQNLTQTMQALAGDIEQQMDAMRNFQHSAVFRFAAQDISGQLPLETLSDYLSALADLILEVSIQTIWQTLSFKHREVPKFAIIGYGKLGGKELGYSSDLDVIFLFKDDADDVKGIYARFAQRINNWFSSITPAGMLYEIDLQLRPDGNSGLLVSSTDAFLDYQMNRAWTWEHQAITRARFVAGDADVGHAFEAVRDQVMQQPRDLDKLKTSVLEMRDKMRSSQRLNPELFDLKHSAGGIIDVEFMVQYLVLANAAQHADLTENIGNIALLKKLAALAIIDDKQADQVADAYREFRRLQHAARLQGEMDAKVEAAQLENHAAAVRQLWERVFVS